jgi:acetyltransferase-like isoleucine patch superfamily enzyme
VGENCYVEPAFYCSFGFNLSVGDHFFANRDCLFMDDAPITFGDYVFIAPGCHFYTASHPIHPQPRNQKLEQSLPITVGNNVWFGGGVKVLPGVTIGDNAVIGAGSVVTHDIPENVLAYGNPCRVIRQLD